MNDLARLQEQVDELEELVGLLLRHHGLRVEECDHPVEHSKLSPEGHTRVKKERPWALSLNCKRCNLGRYLGEEKKGDSNV